MSTTAVTSCREPLHLATDSELVYVGLKGKCEKWCRHKWVGPRGTLAYSDLCCDLWSQWQLLGDSVPIQWAPSHVGVQGNECADANTSKGARIAHQRVLAHKAVIGIWEHLGLEEMLDPCDLDSNQ